MKRGLKGGQLATTTLMPSSSGWLVNFIFPWKPSPIGLLVILIAALFPAGSILLVYSFAKNVSFTNVFNFDNIVDSISITLMYSMFNAYFLYLFFIRDASSFRIILSAALIFVASVLFVAVLAGISLTIILPIFILIGGISIYITLSDLGFFR